MTRAVLSLGANVGDRLAALRGAVDALASFVTVATVSPVYETAPVGVVDQPAFLNAVVLVDTDLDPGTLLARCHAVELAGGRVRGERWGPRTLDIDLVTYGDVVSDDPAVTLPHPRAHERAFVLRPWLDVDPDAVLPGHGRVAELVTGAAGDVRPAGALPAGARPARPAGARSGGAPSGGAPSEGAPSEGVRAAGALPEGALPEGARPAGARPAGVRPAGAEPREPS